MTRPLTYGLVAIIVAALLLLAGLEWVGRELEEMERTTAD